MPEPIINMPKKDNNITDKLPKLDPIVDDPLKDKIVPSEIMNRPDVKDLSKTENKRNPENYNADEFSVGVEIEHEHKPTFDMIKKVLDKTKNLPTEEEIYKSITIDHLSEFFAYYNDKTGLPNMERTLKGEKKHTNSIVKSADKDNELIEKLASLEHEQWMEWSKDIASKEKLSEDRTKRWGKYWIDYSKLDEKTKEEDRKWARKVLDIINPKIENKPIDIKESKNNDEFIYAIEIEARLIQKVNPKTGNKEWALVSKSDNAKVLKWFGKSKPSKENVSKQEKRIQYFKHNASENKPQIEGETKMESKIIDIQGKKYTGISDGKYIYLNNIDAEELGMDKIELHPDNKVKAFKNVETYIEYLQGTYIPDLKENGKDATAKDLEDIIKFLEGATQVGKWKNKEELINFLEKTLIPDLKRSGDEFTAEDFETGVKFLKTIDKGERFESIHCPECGAKISEKSCECGWNLDKEMQGLYDDNGNPRDII